MQNTTTEQIRFPHVYATASGAVALQATDGESWWLADLDGNKISCFCANRAEVTIQAYRRFGRLIGRGHSSWR
ncbi:hypothetical protein ACH4UM_23830 [Streptomyces sp. NPDC020801]|uniref:hypothetical protein n=1 Tax=Streptomyces sp. NPDC020801 TaxID=3365093 RepID=UPI0037B824A7